MTMLAYYLGFSISVSGPRGKFYCHFHFLECKKRHIVTSREFSEYKNSRKMKDKKMSDKNEKLPENGMRPSCCNMQSATSMPPPGWEVPESWLDFHQQNFLSGKKSCNYYYLSLLCISYLFLGFLSSLSPQLPAQPIYKEAFIAFELLI